MVSLIVATVNRVAELDRLLASLEAQTFKDFEVIVIDQNIDDRLAPLLRRYAALRVLHLRSEKGAARSRNAGLRVATGEYIAFPDDDCWYPPSLLASVVQWLVCNSSFDALFTTMRDADDQLVGPRWPRSSCLVTKSNLWNTTIFVTAFLRRPVTDAVGYFREDIGVGAATPYQSGEESDYFLRALALDFRMCYDPGPSLVVHHPNLHSLPRLRATTYPYSLGAGYVMRLHGYSWPAIGAFVTRSLGGALVSLGKADPAMARVYLLRAAGQLRGYLWGPRDLARFNSRPS